MSVGSYRLKAVGGFVGINILGRLNNSLRRSAYPYQPFVGTVSGAILVLTGTSIP